METTDQISTQADIYIDEVKENATAEKEQTVLDKEQAIQHNHEVAPGYEQAIQQDATTRRSDDGTPDGQYKHDESRYESNDDPNEEKNQASNFLSTGNEDGMNMTPGEDQSFQIETEHTTISLPGHSHTNDDSAVRDTGEGFAKGGSFSGNEQTNEHIVITGDKEYDGKSKISFTEDQSHSNQDHRPSDSRDTRNDFEVVNVPQVFTEDQERQTALEKIKRSQTYDEEEDYEMFENDQAYTKAYDKARDKYVFFWKNHDIYSQWNTKNVFYVDGLKFNCAEQFMMYKKAELFRDEEIAEKILWCKDPRKIKALGRQVRKFDPYVWGQYCLSIVKEGNMAKFTQNEDFLAELLLTYPKVLVEASPYDKIWGIGLEEHSPEAWEETTWAGTNYLGYVITEVRDDIMVERGMIDDKDREKYIERLLAQAGYDITAMPVKQTEDSSHKREDYFFFFKGIYSQWHKSDFKVNGIKFRCAEQFMMYKKAVLFQDNETAEQLLKCGNPKKIRDLGRKIKGFSEKIWDQHCLQIVKEGNLAKFSQNETLRDVIVKTYPKIFVASLYDKFWGIGLNEDDPNAKTKCTWKGKNCLGYILTEVRDEIMVECGRIKREKMAKYIDMLQKDGGTSVDNEIQNDDNIAKKVEHSPFEHVAKMQHDENSKKHVDKGNEQTSEQIVVTGDKEYDEKSKISFTEDQSHSYQDHRQSDSRNTRNDFEVVNVPQVFTEDQERQTALEKIKRSQTYDDEEDFETIENDKAYIEANDKARDKYVFFWKNHDIYSQWNTKYVFYVDGLKFNCAEQFMMYKKAELFRDEEIAEKILWCKDPRKIKALGRQVRKFDPYVWGQYCLSIVKEGNMAKFTQNEDFLAELLLTYPKVLVEASPYDKIWGIGLEEHSPEAWDESTWAGTNYLGYVITEVRDDIMVERGQIDDKDRERYIERLLAEAGYDITTMPVQQTEDSSHKREDYFFFFHGIYSQWHKSDFKVDDTKFRCAEQFMMYKKAVLFQDKEMADQLLKCDNPKKIHDLGRKVQRFSQKIWDQHCLQIVKEGNLAKFSQNKKLRNEIMKTYPKIFVACLYDKFWGIGLNEDDPNAKTKCTWKGKNCLGYILTEVRDEIMVDCGRIKREKIAKYIDMLQKDGGTSVDNEIQNDDNIDKQVEHSPFDYASQACSGLTKERDRYNFDERHYKSVHASGAKSSAKMQHDENTKKHIDEFRRNADDRETFLPSQNQSANLNNGYQTQGETKRNMTNGKTANRNKVKHATGNGTDVPKQETESRELDRAVQNKNQENAHSISKNVGANERVDEHEKHIKNQKEKEMKTSHTLETNKRANQPETTGYSNWKIEDIHVTAEKIEPETNQVETMSTSQKKKQKRAKKKKQQSEDTNAEKIEPEKDQVETMSKSQQKKQKKAKEEKQQSEAQKVDGDMKESPSSSGLSRRQRKNQNKRKD